VQQSEDTQQDHDHANVPQATEQALTRNTDVIGEEEGPFRGRKKGGRGGKRAGNTGQQRSLTVNNGHSKTLADQGRNALTRHDAPICAGVRFPPAPQNIRRICPAQGICAFVVLGS
jgi:hypothetical protein